MAQPLHGFCKVLADFKPKFEVAPVTALSHHRTSFWPLSLPASVEPV